jgi:ATP phosphoribosyltransferase
MRVAGLKAISTVVDSSAILIQSRHPTDEQLVKKIMARIRGFIGRRFNNLSVEKPTDTN